VSWFDHARSYFAKSCTDKQLYYTLCLLGASELSINKNLPALAAMNTHTGKVNILFHPDVEQLFSTAPNAFNFLVFHEVRHITQGGTHPSTIELPDLSPLVKKGQEMEVLATKQEDKDRWRKWTDQLGDRTNPITVKLLNTAINIGMDVAVNRDGVLVWGDDALNQLEEFVKRQFEKSTGIVTVQKLEEMLKTKLSPEAEWLYYTNEYLKHMADGTNDPDDAPQECFAQIDDHGERGEAADAEGHKVCKDACERAQEEAKFMAHKAGRDMADLKFTSSPTPIDKKIKKLVDAFKFKIKTILVPSPEEIYNYNVFNRLWQTHDLPGSMNIEAAKPAVVLVVDVSGSCWRTDWLNQMIAVSRHLLKQKKLASMWSFDVQLQQITPDSGPVILSGGGGTVWGPEFTDILVKTSKTKKIDLVLLSDMDIYGLEELRSDPRVVFHPIDLTKHLIK
jgi:hypothetical protein